LIGLLLCMALIVFATRYPPKDERILSFTVDCKAQNLEFFWKNDQGQRIGSIENLKKLVASNGQELVFATNGGMFKPDFSAQGLFIQNGVTLIALDTNSGAGNFYLMPNGVFYLTIDNVPFICKTSDFRASSQIKYATQSGPMLVIDGQIHPVFQAGSTNLNIRNGVGILPDGKAIFAMSKEQINLFNFARYFQKLGCKNALYLDGFVSRTYLPEQNWEQIDGNFGVIIGITE
jgi:uncharacterized protein YigE (DUF2233 family)